MPLLLPHLPALPQYDAKSGRLGSIAGLIARAKLPGFERTLFRATRGNMYLRSMEVGKVKDPASAELVEKAVFVVFFSGERARTKIGKVRRAALRWAGPGWAGCCWWAPSCDWLDG